jgi:hypothetical protein
MQKPAFLASLTRAIHFPQEYFTAESAENAEVYDSKGEQQHEF